MTEMIKVGGVEVPMRASAAIPRLYRIKFHRDVLRDMQDIDKAIQGGDELPMQLLTAFENMAYLMAKHANPSVPDDVGEWLDQYDTFDIYEAMPQIADLWSRNLETVEDGKKKHGRLSAR